MTVKALPGSALEVIETKFFFQLLVSLPERDVWAFTRKLDGRYALAAELVISAQT